MAVTLVYFGAAVAPDGDVVVTWETAAEIKNAGFNLFRAPTIVGPFERINERLIPARGSLLQGAAYRFLDSKPSAGPLYYRLEDVDTAGRGTWHGPVAAWRAAVRRYLPIVSGRF
jgi:hypothetical protein